MHGYIIIELSIYCIWINSDINITIVVYDGAELNSSVAGVAAAKIDSNTPHTRRKHRRAKSGSKIEANGDGNGK